ncbi:ABC transporter permease [Candidatus Beckwithbacteria bacterium]|nr:ABC transporter permease [Candidatus Beckwithbacteria bacterium]
MIAIYILWLRQIKRYIRTPSRIIGSLGQPILFMLAFGMGFSSLYARSGQGNYIDFIAPGIMAQGIMFTAIFAGVELIFDRQFGFLKETFVAPVSRFEIILGRCLGGATIATIQGVLIFFLTLLMGFRPSHLLYLPLALFIMFLIGLFFTSLGTAIACTMKDFHGFQLIMSYLAMPLFFFSGALFPITNLPYTVQVITNANPLSYGVTALRILLLNSFNSPLLFNSAILIAFSVATLAIASYLFSKIEL